MPDGIFVRAKWYLVVIMHMAHAHAQSSCSSDEPMLSAEGLVIGFSGRPLARLRSFSLRKGEIVTLSGPSGCGKTTLLRTLAGLLDPLQGTLLSENQSPAQTGYPLFRSRIMLLPQQPALHDCSVEENLRRPFHFGTQHTHSYPQHIATKLFDVLNLDRSMLGVSARSLSVGEQQRICLVRALLLSPRVLLLDEPMSALDDAAASRVKALLRDSTKTYHMSILLVSHQTKRTADWHDRAIALESISSESHRDC